MKEILSNLNKVFDSRMRIGIMAILLSGNWVDFTTLRNTLEATDGNLSSHLSSLEKNNMIKLKRQFIKGRPRTSYKISRNGLRKFTSHLNAIEGLVEKIS
ncbi:MAG: transcriptional regulator [Bacteroidota bacterium]